MTSAALAAPSVDLAIPALGSKNHISNDREHGLIRKWATTDAAAHDEARLADVLDASNTASDVRADTAYRSAKNEAMLKARALVPRVHRKKPKGVRKNPDIAARRRSFAYNLIRATGCDNVKNAR